MPLKVELWQADIIDKRLEYLRFLYNYIQGKLLRQYKYFIQQDEFTSLKTFKDKSDFFKSHVFTITGILGRDKNLLNISFTEYGIGNFVTKLGQKLTGEKTYKELGINSINLAALSANIWSSWDKFLYHKGKTVHFKRIGEQNTIEFSTIKSHGKQVFIGLTIDLEKMTVSLKLNSAVGKKEKWMTMAFGSVPLTDYENNALALGFDSIRTVTIARKNRNGKRKYYIQLTFRGSHSDKNRELGKGCVGIDIGPSTIAVSSLNGLGIDKLADKADSIEHDKWLLQRKIDRSRRATNPQSYNEDGTIKRGIRLVWHQSNRYKALVAELNELQRHQVAVRKTQHIEMANALLKLGDTFIVENNPIDTWVKKAKETKVSEKTGRYLKKKRYGKSVANHAPSEFVTILKNKVLSLGGKFIEVDPKNAASRFDFTNGDFNQHELKERRITLSNGDIHQRDLLAAFNLQHLRPDSEELKDYDVEAMKKDYPVFCRLEREEMERYKEGKKQNDKSTIDAF